GFNRYVPDDVLGKYGADALRLWATRGRIGTDLRYNEKDVRTGRKFAVKLWNVGRFLSLNQLEQGRPDGPFIAVADRDIVDRWLLSHLAETTDAATGFFEEHDYMQAHAVASRMFWSVFCDRYLEMVKDRLGGGDGPVPGSTAPAGAESARQTLRESFRVLLGLFAPFAPFVTEHLYQAFYASLEGGGSLHVTRWPATDAAWRDDTEPARRAVDQLTVILDAIRALRTQLRLGNSARLRSLTLQAHTAPAGALLDEIAEPLRLAARADAVLRGDAVLPGDAGHPSGVDGITVAITV
ncbi:MAG TPA: class I tRNA ligase family protein, partial [Trebonia sp.]|nr:class I tRNA ligase family protein [Trebonia sp.]